MRLGVRNWPELPRPRVSKYAGGTTLLWDLGSCCTALHCTAAAPRTEHGEHQTSSHGIPKESQFRHFGPLQLARWNDSELEGVSADLSRRRFLGNFLLKVMATTRAQPTLGKARRVRSFMLPARPDNDHWVEYRTNQRGPVVGASSKILLGTWQSRLPHVM